MRAIISLAGCELRRALGSYLAWVAGAVVVMLAALLFSLQLLKAQQLGGGQSLSYVNLRQLYDTTATLLAFVTPVLTMHLLSDEQRSGSLDLLLAAPLSCTHIMLGKFLGGFGLLALPVLLVTLIPAAMLPFAPLDLGMVALYLAATLLYAAALAALGLYASSLAGSPVVAAVICFAAILLLGLCGLSRYFLAPEETLTQVLAYLFFFGHHQELLSGWFSTANVAYYLLLAGLCMALTAQRLETRRTLP